MKPVEADEDNFYSWGDRCSGWKLLELDHLQVRQEAMPPATAEEPHVHRYVHQFFYILDGRMTLCTPDDVMYVGPGQGIHVPAGVPHCVRNECDSDLSFVVSSSPSTAGDRSPVDTTAWKIPKR